MGSETAGCRLCQREREREIEKRGRREKRVVSIDFSS